MRMTRRTTGKILLTLSMAAFAAAHAAAPRPKGDQWAGTWATAIAIGEKVPTVSDTTVREVVHVSVGGTSLRLKLSNEFGTAPLVLGGVHIAMDAGAGALQPGTDTAVLFGGKSEVTIPAGEVGISDAVKFNLPPLSNLAVSIYVAQQPPLAVSLHTNALTSNFVAAGEQLASATMQNAKPLKSWYFLREVDVQSARVAAVVALGDSITDGATSTVNTNSRWPDVLAARLQADSRTKNISVLNEGIGGNRILSDTNSHAGESVLKRFDRDVLSASGVKYVIIMEGINDIGVQSKSTDPVEAGVTVDKLIAAYKELVQRAHAKGIKVFGATQTPFLGAGYQTPHGEEMHEAVNQWIRGGGGFDGVIDFDKVISDPAHPNTFLPAYNFKDHLHPNDAGYKAMGDAIDLSLFTK